MTQAATRGKAPQEIDLLSGYSLEITAKEDAKLGEVAEQLPQGSIVSITFLPNETMDMRVAAAVRLRKLGLTPMPHLSARRLNSAVELRAFLTRLAGEAGVDRAFVVAGDCDTPQGPFEDALSLIRTGELAEHGVKLVGVGGYPEGHPSISKDKLARALVDKSAHLSAQGLGCEIMTQFSFDADPVLTWLAEVRRLGVHAPVRVGLPGPANVATLLRFAARCGVGASAKVMTKYGASLTRVLNSAGPDRLVADLTAGLDPDIHGRVGAHFYPFGGLTKTVAWASAHAPAQAPSDQRSSLAHDTISR